MLKKVAKWTLIMTIILSLLIIAPAALADDADISGLSPILVTAENLYNLPGNVNWNAETGEYGGSGTVKVGDQLEVPAAYHNIITFWNVGAAGGTRYETAVFTTSTIATAPGLLVTGFKTVDYADGPQQVPITEPTLDLPSPKITSEVEFTFTGGRNGLLTGETAMGKVVFQVVDGGRRLLITEGYGAGTYYEVSDYETAFPPKPAETPSETPKDVACKFSSLNGQVEISYPDKPKDYKGAEMTSPIYPGCHIKTQEDSSVILTFPDMSSFVLEADSEWVINEQPGQEGLLVRITGTVWSNIKTIAKTGRMEIEMNQAVAGIKGTTFVIESNDDTSTLKLIEGSVEMTAKADGAKVVLKSGECISADATGFGEISTFDAEAEQAAWDAILQDAEGAGDGHMTLVQLMVIGAATLVVISLVTLLIVLSVNKKKAHQMR